MDLADFIAKFGESELQKQQNKERIEMGSVGTASTIAGLTSKRRGTT